MSKKHLSIVCACLTTCMLFILMQLFVADTREALASSSSFNGRMIVEDGRYTLSQKREIRQKVLQDQNELLNLTGAEIRAILAQPELVRRDEPTTVWQYRNDSCVIDLYFTTASPKALKAPVVHYEARPRHDEITEEFAQSNCVQALVRDSSPSRFVSFESIYKSQ